MDYSSLLIAGQPVAVGTIASLLTQAFKNTTWFPEENKALYCQLITGVFCACITGAMAYAAGESISAHTLASTLVGYLTALGFFNQFLQK